MLRGTAMTSRITISAIRFGDGLRPGQDGPAGPFDLLASLGGRPAPTDAVTLRRLVEGRRLIQAVRGTDREEHAAARDVLRAALRQALQDWLARRIDARHGFPNRLEAFWFDHFAVKLPSLARRALIGPYLDEAIRPHIAGRFADLLKAVTLHPAMLYALDQAISVGPGSPVARTRAGASMRTWRGNCLSCTPSGSMAATPRPTSPSLPRS